MPVCIEKNKKKWKKDGSKYYFRHYYTTPTGKRKQYHSGYYLDYDTAEEEEAKWILKTRLTNSPHENINISFYDVYMEWFEWKKRQVKSTTYYSYRKCFDKNILSFFKEYKLHYININTIYSWYDFLDKTTLRTETKNKMIGYLKDILNYANIHYKFDAKIISSIHKQNSEEIVTTIRDAEWNYWTQEEFSIFIKNVENESDKLIFTFLYYTGLRIGEFIALNWTDINFKKKTLNINKSFTNKLGNGSFKITTPKTKNSVRIMDLDDELKERLQVLE